jgi:hypothetical protein
VSDPIFKRNPTMVLAGDQEPDVTTLGYWQDSICLDLCTTATALRERGYQLTRMSPNASTEFRSRLTGAALRDPAVTLGHGKAKSESVLLIDLVLANPWFRLVFLPACQNLCRPRLLPSPTSSSRVPLQIHFNGWTPAAKHKFFSVSLEYNGCWQAKCVKTPIRTTLFWSRIAAVISLGFWAAEADGATLI